MLSLDIPRYPCLSFRIPPELSIVPPELPGTPASIFVFIYFTALKHLCHHINFELNQFFERKQKV